MSITTSRRFKEGDRAIIVSPVDAYYEHAVTVICQRGVWVTFTLDGDNVPMTRSFSQLRPVDQRDRTLEQVEDWFWDVNGAMKSYQNAFHQALKRNDERRPFTTALVLVVHQLEREEAEAYRALHDHPEYRRA